MQKVSSLGIKVVYPCVWNKNSAFWKSSTIQKTLGESAISEYGDRDILQEFVDEASLLGLKVFPWFEYGLKVVVKKGPDTASSELTESGKIFLHKGWLTSNREGDVTMPFKWGVQKGFLNPENDKVKTFLNNIMIELSSYDVEGVVIDDHFSMHPDYAYNKRSSYRSESRSHKQNLDISAIKISSITNLLVNLGQTIRSAGKKFILSPAGDLNFSKSKWMQDWFSVVESGVVSQLLLQAYRYNLNGFKNLLKNYHFNASRNHTELGVVILAGLKNNTKMDGRLISEQSKVAQMKNLKTSYFFYDTLLKPASGKESQTQRLDAMKSILSTTKQVENEPSISDSIIKGLGKSLGFNDFI